MLTNRFFLSPLSLSAKKYFQSCIGTLQTEKPAWQSRFAYELYSVCDHEEFPRLVNAILLHSITNVGILYTACWNSRNLGVFVDLLTAHLEVAPNDVSLSKQKLLLAVRSIREGPVLQKALNARVPWTVEEPDRKALMDSFKASIAPGPAAASVRSENGGGNDVGASGEPGQAEEKSKAREEKEGDGRSSSRREIAAAASEISSLSENRILPNPQSILPNDPQLIGLQKALADSQQHCAEIQKALEKAKEQSARFRNQLTFRTELWLKNILPFEKSPDNSFILNGAALVHPLGLLAAAELRPGSVASEDAGRLCFFETLTQNDTLSPLQYTRRISVLETIHQSPSYHLTRVFGLVKLQTESKEKCEQQAPQLEAIATEYIVGVTLEELLRLSSAEPELKLDLLERLRLAMQLIEACQHLSECDIVHGRISPSHVRVSSDVIYQWLRTKASDSAAAGGGARHPHFRDPTTILTVDALAAKSMPARLLQWDGFYYSRGAADKITTPVGTTHRLVVTNSRSSLKPNLDKLKLSQARELLKGDSPYDARTYMQTMDVSLDARVDTSEAASRFWRDYDCFGLAMCIMDLIRGCTLQFKDPQISPPDAWNQYMKSESDASHAPPSLVEFMLRSEQCIAEEWFHNPPAHAEMKELLSSTDDAVRDHLIQVLSDMTRQGPSNGVEVGEQLAMEIKKALDHFIQAVKHSAADPQPANSMVDANA